MAVPSTGQVTMRGIRREIGNNNYNASVAYTNISLEDMSEGVNGTINSGSSSKPNGTNPHKMSEFRGYDHDASSVTSFLSGGGQPDAKFLCSQLLGNTYYHNGSGTFPAVGDTVYTNSGGTTALGNGFYSRGSNAMSGPTGYYQVSGGNGVVSSIGSC